MQLRRRRKQATQCEWLRLLEEPGLLGPHEPEQGFEILVAVKREELAESGDGIEVHFQIGRYGWHDDRWHSLSDDEGEGAIQTKSLEESRRSAVRARRRREAGGGDDWWLIWPHLPRDAEGNVIAAGGAAAQVKPEEPLFNGLRTVWPGDSAIDVLAAAWFDYCQWVREANRSAWEKRLLREKNLAEARIIAEQRRDTINSQRGVSSCLPGPTIEGPSLAQVG